MKYEDSLSELAKKNEDSYPASLRKACETFWFFKGSKGFGFWVLGLGRSIESGTPKKFGITFKFFDKGQYL